MLRLVAILAVVFIAACAVLFMFTGQRRYLDMAKRGVKITLWLLAAFCGLFFIGAVAA